MKLTETNNRMVTLRLSRREMADLMDTLALAVGVLLERGLRHKDERFLPRVQALLQQITEIVIANGWTERLRGRGCALIRNFVNDETQTNK